jgi:predicted membrane protein
MIIVRFIIYILKLIIKHNGVNKITQSKEPICVESTIKNPMHIGDTNNTEYGYFIYIN